MANVTKVLATIKAVFTRLVFACHGIIAIWQVTVFKNNIEYWYLASPILLLIFEGIFTLTIKENQEWKWFCPSVFIYLGLVVPAIWLIELHKVDMRLANKNSLNNNSANSAISVYETEIPLPGATKIPTETWVTLIEQFLMLTLIVGRWLLPKGDLTRDQLSQLLLVYIGTAADIIEFFDSFKDAKEATEKVLILLTLAIWSWSLVQFTVVLTATKSRKSRGAANRSDMSLAYICRESRLLSISNLDHCMVSALSDNSHEDINELDPPSANVIESGAPPIKAIPLPRVRGWMRMDARSDEGLRSKLVDFPDKYTNSRACCCSIEVCAIIMNIALQDAPFLAFRLLIICHYKIVNYMNVFFTCKNTLVILLQIYRLYVLHLETVDDGNGGSVYRKKHKHKSSEKKDKDRKHKKHKSKKHRKHETSETSIAMISDPRKHDKVDGGRIRAIILTNSDDIRELELSTLFRDQISIENEKKKSSKKKHKSDTSEESLNNIHHTTDDSGI